MTESLAILEDAAYRRFLPLAHTRPTYELLCGAMSLRERIERGVGSEARLYCRPYLAATLGETVPRRINDTRLRGRTPVLFVNGRLLDPAALDPVLETSARPGSWWNGNELVAARLEAEDAADLLLTLESNDFILEPGMLPSAGRHVLAATLVAFPWELFLHNGARLAADYEELAAHHAGAGATTNAQVLGDDLLIAPGARIDPGAVLDASGGPILIGSGVRIAGPTRVEGPAAIGAGAQLVGGKIRAGTTIGPHCRVGGEVEASIFHGYTNKYHDGFIGHSYVGEWVNLGALTTNSDLKNTYGPIKTWNDGRLVDTGESKVGALIGDHAKTGIGTLLDTGTVIGVAANIFGGGMTGAKWVPSFSWGNPPELKSYDPDRCLRTMQTVMARRQRSMTDAYRDLIDALCELTAKERDFAGIRPDA